uniref:Putative secreted mucin n=1 Tax=Anopheles aquasalis TaxID=42839 RepID=T1DPX6_ANOAQ
MLLLAFRSFFFIVVLLGYSTGIWRLINDYFRREFQSYLTEEVKTNKYLLQDPPQRSSTNVPTTTSSSPPPLEEHIVRVGQVLVARTTDEQPKEEAKPLSGPDDPGEQHPVDLHETGPQERIDEEARWLHYWKQRNGAAQRKAQEPVEADGVCSAVHEPDETTNSNQNLCPG